MRRQLLSVSSSRQTQQRPPSRHNKPQLQVSLLSPHSCQLHTRCFAVPAEEGPHAAAAGHLAGTDIAIAQLHVGRDSVELADASWQRSTLELCAQLGACRERKLELEWQLKVAKEAASQARRLSRSWQLEFGELSHMMPNRLHELLTLVT